MVSLPESVGQVTALKKLYLSKCSSLVSLPVSVGQMTASETPMSDDCSNLTTQRSQKVWVTMTAFKELDQSIRSTCLTYLV